VIGVEPLVEKKKAEGLTLDGGMFTSYFVLPKKILLNHDLKAYGADPPETRYGFEDEVRSSTGFGITAC